MGLSSSMTPYLGKSARFFFLYEMFCVMSRSINYCCDPFKKHRRLHTFALSSCIRKLIAECPSLFLRSGDLPCVNCLNASEHAGPSGHSQEPSHSTPYSSTQDSDSASDSE